ncbi:pyruvate formate-lyase-activating protein [Caldibacillus lycopersici]|uniref:Pyruvate formate-lyase-activating enzyme n=1 Tax=Perspicuibacillus lycopersici TaxID=1325689 RepID=A0AAE3LNB0_9BACI|nr:pyruvate formate-lyase-activating protein [Perspicuibacillus lycopersici]MCU9614500.1 pyruvate formate-lyase-activating protein [Perspicuibacillus lycopersici]
MVTGRIHSVETFGAVDGPGLRYIVFTQGCLLRCQYCHNPDTWKIGNGKETTVQEIMADLVDYLPFFEATGGGITVSGGEPLLQMDFLIELFKECKKLGIHTTIDSSGGPFSRRHQFMEKLDELLGYTDLILLDLKHIDSAKHKIITGLPNEHILDFATYLSEKNIPIWVRHVLVPTLSDFDEDLICLADFIKTLNNVQKIEVLPYHIMGIYKWESLGLQYKLQGVEPPSNEQVENARRILNGGLVEL